MKFTFFKKYQFELNLALHGLLGVLTAFLPILLFPWVFGILFMYGFYPLLRGKNTAAKAHLGGAYMAGMEMVLRMSRSGFPHEMVKYSVILLLGIGLFSRPSKQPRANIMILFFVLLLPSILVMDASLDLESLRQSISFNLSGPMCLALAAYYFYRRPMPLAELGKILQMILLPIATTLGYLFIRTPSVSEIQFSYGANFAASGYGPNQMSSMLGFGIMAVAMGFILKLSIWRSNLVILAFLGLLAFRGLLTFSRGGMVGPVLALICAFAYYTYASGIWRAAAIRRIGAFILLGGVLYVSFAYVNALTGNILLERYTGQIGGKSLSIDKYSSGRSEILAIDLAIFNDYPIAGIGPGMGNDRRIEYGYGERVAAHIEYSRLLAEHGLFGLAALLIMLLFPLWEFRRRRRNMESCFLLIACTLFCFAFMAHSATRIALPMFVYGLGFAYLIENQLPGKPELRNRRTIQSIKTPLSV